jgi:hypothetical protein
MPAKSKATRRPGGRLLGRHLSDQIASIAEEEDRRMYQHAQTQLSKTNSKSAAPI